MSEERSYWQRCSSCKKPIGFEAVYWVCSVSTCTRKRTGMVFCSVGCWEVHLPMMRHREAYAVEERSPSAAAWAREQAEDEAANAAAAPSSSSSGPPSPGLSAAASSAASGAARAAGEAGDLRAAPASGTPPAARRVVSEPRREPDVPIDVLVVASKLKQYVKARSGFNTSDAVMRVLSDHVRELCNIAIRNAGEDGRKTVMDRDFPTPSRVYGQLPRK